MNQEFFWALVVMVWVFGWAVIWLLRKKAREALTLSRREMLHRERLAAIEKGLPMDELPPEEEEAVPWFSAEVDRLRNRWLLRISLVLGLVAVTTGVGICLGFYFAPDRGFYGMWSVGLIPLMGGFGFLLFWKIATGSSASP